MRRDPVTLVFTDHAPHLRPRVLPRTHTHRPEGIAQQRDKSVVSALFYQYVTDGAAQLSTLSRAGQTRGRDRADRGLGGLVLEHNGERLFIQVKRKGFEIRRCAACQISA
ncbi:hypothetical protein D3C72_2135600 [compost metagenome]